MGNATIIHDKNEKGQGYFFECPISEVSIDPHFKVVGIYKSNGNWNEYELIDYDKLDDGDLYVTIGKYLRTIYCGH